MANSLFCSSCGKKNLYEVTKPRNCGYCGNQFGSIPFVASVSKPSVAPVYKPTFQPQPQEQTTGDFQRMKGFDTNIIVEPVRGESLGNLAVQTPEHGRVRPPAKKSSKKELQQFMQEAGSSRTSATEINISIED